MWRMLINIMRFNACALRVLNEKDTLFIGEYLQREGYSSRFWDDYLILGFPLPSVLLISHWFWCSAALCIVAYDGRGVAYPTRCMRHGQPKRWFDSCTNTTCRKSRKVFKLHGLLSKVGVCGMLCAEVR
jgi:hypothetical protein